MATVTVCDYGNTSPLTARSLPTLESCRESPEFVVVDCDQVHLLICAKHLNLTVNHLLTTSLDGGAVQVRLYEGEEG